MIDHDYVMSAYYYDCITGILTYRKSAGNRKAGESVGWVDGSNGIEYLVTKCRGVKVRVHRLIFFYVYGRWPIQVDHVNGTGTDNRLCNLREVSGSENNMNTRILKNNSTGLHGVNWYHKGKWRAYITFKRKQQPLGYFDNFFDACAARKSAEVRLGFHKNHGAR